MATVLIIGSHRESQVDLATCLRARGHSVHVSDYQDLPLSAWTRITPEVEIAIFDVTSINKESMAALQRLCLSDCQTFGKPLVLCYSGVNRGPDFELSMERLGARFVYV